MRHMWNGQPVNGVGDNKFAPEQAITREQLVTMLTNYIVFTGLTLTELLEDADTFADHNKISSYANNGVSVMQRATNRAIKDLIDKYDKLITD